MIPISNVSPSCTPTFSTISCFSERKCVGHCFRIPARDRVIDLGKYKGKMLGSLPSSYLNWVSKNLRAGDTQEWAKLADEVLGDEVYKDRIEWEFAENVLNGNNVRAAASVGNDAVSLLLEISDRFGWDNEDKAGWSGIDFALLGTSKGGRIPRLVSKRDVESEQDLNKDKESEDIDDEGRRRRRARRERTRQLSAQSKPRFEIGNVKIGNQRGEDEVEQVQKRNPFPGREALLKKAANFNRKGSNG